MTARFEVGAYDKCGEHETRLCGMDWALTLQVAAEMRRRWPDKIIVVRDVDNIDLGWSDGLTEAQREQVGDALDNKTFAPGFEPSRNVVTIDERTPPSEVRRAARSLAAHFLSVEEKHHGFTNPYDVED